MRLALDIERQRPVVKGANKIIASLAIHKY
jgi:hypothetical protein